MVARSSCRSFLEYPSTACQRRARRGRITCIGTGLVLRPLPAPLLLSHPQLLQDKDERLNELEKKLTQVQCLFLEKEMELEKLQSTTKELDANLQEVRQSTSRIDNEGLRSEIQKLKESLGEAREQLRVSGETPTHTAPPHSQTSSPKWPH